MKLRNKDAGSVSASVEKRQPKQVCILGTAETMAEAPFDSEGWEIWAVSTVLGHAGLKRIDRLIEIHEPSEWKPRAEQINAAKVPVWMWKHYEEIPLSEPFPLDDVDALFKRRYYTNSISMLIAEAIREKASDIGLFGVHMATTNEYAEQRPSVEYFLGFAEGRGINLWIPDGSDMLKAARLYGYQSPSEIHKKINSLYIDMSKKAENYSQQELVAKDMKNQAIGWREAMKHMKQLVNQ
jgi:hypothetical protein